jgi:long-chain acyl-CoA synthetase
MDSTKLGVHPVHGGVRSLGHAGVGLMTGGSNGIVEPIGVAALAQADPDRTAIVDGDLTLSYVGLTRRAHQVVHALTDLGMAPGDVLAAAIPNSTAHFELRHAVSIAGWYLAPLDPTTSPGEVVRRVRAIDARVLIASGAMLTEIQASLDPTDKLTLISAGAARTSKGGDETSVLAYGDLMRNQPTTPKSAIRAGKVLPFSSGTTGPPKAIWRSLSGNPSTVSRSMVANVARLDLRPGRGVHLILGPLHFAASSSMAYAALQLGQTVVVGHSTSPEAILELLQRHRVTSTFMVPTLLHRLVQLPDHVRARYDLSSLTSLVHAGSPCSVELKRQAIAWLGPVVHEFYGAAEGTATAVRAAEWLTKPGTAGLPMPGVDVRVLDPDGHDLPPGKVGLVHYTLSRPFAYQRGDSASERYFTAGDLGYLDADGWLFLQGRRDDVILSGGVNVSPAEVEGVLAAHHDVRDAAVTGLPDEEWGHRLVAFVVLESGVAASPAVAQQLRSLCRERLSRFKVPTGVSFVRELPRSASGKLIRSRLSDLIPLVTSDQSASPERKANEGYEPTGPGDRLPETTRPARGRQIVPER